MVVELIELTLAALDEVAFTTVRSPVRLTVEEMPEEPLVRVVTELVVMAVLFGVVNDAAVVFDVA